MSTPAPSAETVILVDDESVFAGIVHAVKSGEPSLWTRLKGKLLGGSGGRIQGAQVTEIASKGTGFTHSRRFCVNDEIVNFLLIKPEDGQLFGWLTLAEFHERVGIKRGLCISRALSLREDLRTGDVALVTQASALPYPALYASRPPEWQEEDGGAREPQHFGLSNANLRLGRETAARALDNVVQKYIPEIHTGYARHPAWGGGLTPWAGEQFEAMAAEGLEMISEIAVGVCDFAMRMPSVPVVCFNIVAGRAREMAAGDMARSEGKDPTRFAFYSEHTTQGAVRLVSEFLRR